MNVYEKYYEAYNRAAAFPAGAGAGCQFCAADGDSQRGDL